MSNLNRTLLTSPPEWFELVRIRVRATTLKEYDRSLQQFFDWLPEHMNLEPTAELLDECLAQFAIHVFRADAGGKRGMISNVKAGIELYFPEVAGQLHKSKLCLQGWTKVTPVKSYPVCP